MSIYRDLVKELKSARCTSCFGVGSHNDAEPGDIHFNSWKCPDCHGTGLKFAVSLDIDYSANGTIKPQ